VVMHQRQRERGSLHHSGTRKRRGRVRGDKKLTVARDVNPSACRGGGTAKEDGDRLSDCYLRVRQVEWREGTS